MPHFGVFLAEDNAIPEREQWRSPLAVSLRELLRTDDVSDAGARYFVDSFLRFRERPWQRTVDEGTDDIELLKNIDDAVFRYIMKCADAGKVDSAWFLDVASLYTSDAEKVLGTALQQSPELLDSVLSALWQLVASFTGIMQGSGSLPTEQEAIFVVDGADLIRWLPTTLSMASIVGGDSKELLLFLANSYNYLVPQVIRSAAASSHDRSKLQRMARVALTSLLVAADKLLHQLGTAEELDHAMSLITPDDSFGKALQSKLDVAALTKRVADNRLTGNLERDDDAVGKDWFRGRVVDELGYMYDDDVDDEDEDPIVQVDSAANAENEGEGDVVINTGDVTSNNAGAASGDKAASQRGRGRGSATARGATSDARGRGRGLQRGNAANVSSSDAGTQRARAVKDKRKSSVANHSRKDRAARKESKAGF